MKKETFYMIYAENCDLPTYKHKDYESALTEAKRLTTNLKVPCYILEARQVITKNDFIIVQLTREDELPF